MVNFLIFPCICIYIYIYLKKLQFAAYGQFDLVIKINTNKSIMHSKRTYYMHRIKIWIYDLGTLKKGSSTQCTRVEERGNFWRKKIRKMTTDRIDYFILNYFQYKCHGYNLVINPKDFPYICIAQIWATLAGWRLLKQEQEYISYMSAEVGRYQYTFMKYFLQKKYLNLVKYTEFKRKGQF